MPLCQHVSSFPCFSRRGQKACAAIKKIIITGLVISILLSGISHLCVSDWSCVVLICVVGKKELQSNFKLCSSQLFLLHLYQLQLSRALLVIMWRVQSIMLLMLYFGNKNNIINYECRETKWKTWGSEINHPGMMHLTVLIVQAAQRWWEWVDVGFPTHQSITVSDEVDILNLA